jgi:hypothetical protein
MAGFIVSNSFGKFHAESKKFNAPLTGFVNAPSNFTLLDMAKNQSQIPLVDGRGGYPEDWAYDGRQGLVGVDNDKGVSLAYGTSYTAPDVDKLFRWYSSGQIGNEDEVILYDEDAFKFVASPDSIAKFRLRFVGDSPDPYNYVVNIKKSGNTSGQSIPTAAQSSSVSCISNYNNNGNYVDFTVTLDGSNGDYLSVDMNKVSSKVANCKFVTKCGVWSRVDASGSDDPADKGIERVQIKLLSIEAQPVSGCTDPQSDNYNSSATVDDGNCRFTTAEITSFTVSPSEITKGESSTLTWNLSNGNFSEVKVLENGTNIMPIDKKQAQNASIVVSPTKLGNNTYKLQVDWNKPNTAQRNSAVKKVNVFAPTSYIPCTDANRQKDSNGECADCKSGYYLGDDGLCTQCSDPNRKQESDGRCGDCESGYALATDGLCQKSGCMDDTDANYDPDAVVDDASACYGDDGTGGNGGNGGNGGDGDDNGDDDTDDTDDTGTTTTDDGPNLLIPVLLGGAILGGVLLLRK